MRPILFELPFLTLYSHGTAIVVAATAVGLLAWLWRPQGLFTAHQYLDLCVLTTVGAGVGARVAGALLSGSQTGSPSGGGLGLWSQGELSSLGVPLGVLPLLLLYLHRQKLDTVAIFDHLVPFAVLGGAIQRSLGCFLAGCCRGQATSSPFGVLFPGAAEAVHPTQLYLGLSLFLLFLVTVRWHPRPPGLRCLATLGLFGLVNLAVEPLRAAPPDGSWLASPEWIYGGWTLFCGLGCSWLLRRNGFPTRSVQAVANRG